MPTNGKPGGARAPAAKEAGGTRMIVTMGAIGLLSGILIVLTYQLTLPIITVKKARALERAVFEVVPGADHKTVFAVVDGTTLRRLDGDKPAADKLYAAYTAAGDLAGVAVEASGQGFQDAVRILYGYSPEKGAVVGFKVLESKETPGLGDKITKDPGFLANFENLEATMGEGATIVHPIELVKHGEKSSPWQIEAITGATISSRAVTAILKASTAAAVPLIQRNLGVLEQGGRDNGSERGDGSVETGARPGGKEGK